MFGVEKHDSGMSCDDDTPNTKPRSMRTMVTYIGDIKESNNPFKADYGVEEYRSMEEMVGKTIDIYGAERFENQNGPGIYILAKEPVTGKDGDFFYMCTHSIGITETLGTEKVRAVLENEPIRAKIVKRKSQTSDRQVYSLE